MIVVNMTPHPVNICDADGNIVRTYPKGESTIRLAAETVSAGTLLDGTPLTRTEFGDAEGLPEWSIGTYYIVSQLVKSALPERDDLLVPAEVVRDSAGNIVGCKSLGV